MKKLGKSLSFLTKIMLVIGLLISNLSSLSVVFAYEGTEDVLVSLNDGVLKINYLEELAEDVEAVNVKVYENYTYLNDLSEPEVFNEYSLSAEELLAAANGELELTYNSMFANGEDVVKNFEVFDGTYSAKVEIVAVTSLEEETDSLVEESVVLEEDSEEELLELESEEETTLLTETSEEVLATGNYEKVMSHESGLEIKLFDSNDNEITLVDGHYPVTLENSNVKVVAGLKFGGLNPNDQFKYNDQEYLAQELVGYGFTDSLNFLGHLFGEYEVPVKVELLKPVVANAVSEEEEVAEVSEETSLEDYEKVVYEDSIKIMYESYLENAMVLNQSVHAKGYEEAYLFYGDSKDGVLLSLVEFDGNNNTKDSNEVTRTVLDIYNVVTDALAYNNEEEQIITYTILKDGVDVLEGYDASAGVSLEEYLATVLLDETVVLVLSNEGLTITYRLVNIGDLNNDTKLTEEDLVKMIDQVVGFEDIADLDESDIFSKDGEVNSLDVLYLNQLVKTQSWEVRFNASDVELDAQLDVKFNGNKLNEENYLTSGDEFTVDYVLSLADYDVNGLAGLFKYDESLFELVSVKMNYDWLGNSHNGKFLYLGDEALTAPVEDETDSEIDEVVLVEEGTTEEEVTSIDYVVVTATFKALSATDSGVITLEEIELFNSEDEGYTYYNLDNDQLSTEVIAVRASDNNKLSSLMVAGQEIELALDVYEYEITVSNDVTTAEVVAELENVAASITSIVYPEELAEGENVVTVTVVSESGLEQVYTVKVVREEAPKETTTQVNYDNYYGDYEDEEEEIIVQKPEVNDEVEEEKDSNLSRIIIIVLILLVIAGLIYLIFKDEDDQETKKANKEINKLKKEEKEEPVVKTTKTAPKKTTNRSGNNSKNKVQKNNKKER